MDGAVADANLKKNLDYLNEKRGIHTEGGETSRRTNEQGEESENEREKIYRESTENS